MANLVLKNVDQAVLQTLEQRAKRLGITLEAAAVRALSVPQEGEEGSSDRAKTDPIDAFLEGNEANEDRDGPKPGARGLLGSASQDDRAVNVPNNDARSLGARQAALASAYPDEYVVFLGERLVAHTASRDEAHARYEAAFGQPDGLEPIVVLPGASRRLGPPVLRGRAVSGHGSER